MAIELQDSTIGENAALSIADATVGILRDRWLQGSRLSSQPAIWLMLVWLLSLCAASRPADAQVPDVRDEALSPEASAQQFQLASGYSWTMLASEPQVIDPVEAHFDDAGRLWVVEMRDYPFPKGPPDGTIKVLEDSDGDGQLDRAHVFADGLDMPTGLALWRDGAVVTVAGQIVFLRDSDGDLQADQQIPWLEGFAQENEQLRANHPQLGPDGWWYVACGLRGGRVRWSESPSSSPPRADAKYAPEAATVSQPVDVGHRDIRFDPVQRLIQPVTGPGQFGLCFDQFGSRYVCSNRNPAIQVMFEQHALEGNPLLGLVPAQRDVLPAGSASRVFPLVDAWTTSNLHAGQFTAACGVMVLPGDHLSSDIFVCEPTASLVQRRSLDFSGLHPRPLPRSPGTDWLASRDPWFRPVNLGLAPTDSVLVVDMHRAVIEHPKWVPAELKQRPDERWGNATGRLWLISADLSVDLGTVLEELRKRPLRDRESGELLQLMDRSHWFRSIVARLLLERDATECIPQLLSQAGQTGNSLRHRAAAFQLAMALGRGQVFDEVTSTVEDLLAPENPLMLRRVVLRGLTERNQLSDSAWTAVQELAASPGTAQVDALLCLARCGAEELSPAIMQGVTQAADADALVAAAATWRQHPDQLLLWWLSCLTELPARTEPSHPWVETAALRLTAAALRFPEATAELQRQVRLGLKGSATSTGQLALLACARSLCEADPALSSSEVWAEVFRSAEQLAFDAEQPLEVRRCALRLLGHSSDQKMVQRIAELVQLDNESPLRSVAVRAWADSADPACDAHLVWMVGSAPPELRRIALECLQRRPASRRLLAQAMAEGELSARVLGLDTLRKLAQRGPGKEQFQSQLDQLVNSDRQQVIVSYAPALKADGDVSRGQEVFRKHCAACHRIGELGQNVGPDISDARSKSPRELLTAILDPNQAIDNNYFRFVVLTEDDRVLEGIIAEETASALLLVTQDRQQHLIHRSDLRELRATGESLMPTGLESQIDVGAMNDLLTYIKGWRYRGNIPGK